MIINKLTLALALTGTTTCSVSALTDQAHCFDNFESDTSCQDPRDINPEGDEDEGEDHLFYTKGSFSNLLTKLILTYIYLLQYIS